MRVFSPRHRRFLRRRARSCAARRRARAGARRPCEQRPLRLQRHVDRRRVLGPVRAARARRRADGRAREQRSLRLQRCVLHRRRLLRALRAARRTGSRAADHAAAPAGQLRFLQHARAAAAARDELRNARPAASAACDELWNACPAACDELRNARAAAAAARDELWNARPAAPAAGVDDELRFLWNVRRSRCFFAELFVDKGRWCRISLYNFFVCLFPYFSTRDAECTHGHWLLA